MPLGVSTTDPEVSCNVTSETNVENQIISNQFRHQFFLAPWLEELKQQASWWVPWLQFLIFNIIIINK